MTGETTVIGCGWIDMTGFAPDEGKSERRVKLLHLERDEDVSGVSGVGIVAYGAMFPDGSVVLRWDTRVRSTVMYDSLEDLEAITGHGGKTRVVFDGGN